MTSDMLDRDKKRLIQKQLQTIKNLYKANFKRFKKNKRINSILKVTINLCNAVTVSSVVLSFSGAIPILVVTIVSSSIGGIVSVINDTVNFQEKAEIHKTTYLDMLDIYNTYSNLMLKDVVDYDSILSEINNKMGLILNSAIPVSTSSND